jgi:hypothetical protein
MTLFDLFLWSGLLVLLVACLRSIIWQIRNREHLIHALPDEFKDLPLEQRRQLVESTKLFGYAWPHRLAGLLILAVLLLVFSHLYPEIYCVFSTSC